MDLPECRFFLFGMGGRRKLLYQGGALTDAFSGECLGQWDALRERIVPPEYKVEIETAGGREVRICEDAEGVWLQQGRRREPVSRSPVALPDFAGHRHQPLLRVLHQEILINIVPAGPVPNLLAYPRPWYRDAAMMCMALERTGNLHLVSDWIAGLREPFDRNNAGNCEPDNLGQALYMISLVSDAGHPLVETVQQAAEQFRQDRHVVGITDGAEHPVYQTKWLKFGLRSLGLDDPYEIPSVFDSYSALFWWDFKDAHVPGPRFDERARTLYPYLAWAEHHFHGDVPAGLPDASRYPLTWEAHSSEADFPAMSVVSGEYVQRRIAAPHAWHAAEMFLYLLESG
jgi:hypothetical protein